ncbi:Uncharacterised protein [uncultured Blautia sp.]|nr:Uncharacterised protein [uncultured Blautia sp.]
MGWVTGTETVASAVFSIFSRKSSVVRASTSAPRAFTSTTLLMALSKRGA